MGTTSAISSSGATAPGLSLEYGDSLKDHNDSVSLVRLMFQMESCGPQITFEYFLTKFPRKSDYVYWQPGTFRLLSDDGISVSSAIIRHDLKELGQLNADIEAYADRAVAHLDKRGFAGAISFDDIESSIDHFNKLACRYICFLTGAGYASLEATVQFPWERVFGVPLVRPA